ncbi:hypothetical protein ACLB2K_065211 [Fragaria x ananassa]
MRSLPFIAKEGFLILHIFNVGQGAHISYYGAFLWSLKNISDVVPMIFHHDEVARMSVYRKYVGAGPSVAGRRPTRLLLMFGVLPLVACSFNAGVSIVHVAKALALRNSLLCAKERGFTEIEVESDSKLVIDAVNEDAAPPWILSAPIHQDVEEIITFKNVFRETNFAANSLANLDHILDICCFWEDCVPPEASLALSFDCVDFGCTRGISIDLLDTPMEKFGHWFCRFVSLACMINRSA